MSIITYPLDGVTYSAEDVATYLCTRTSGVYAKDSNFAASITGTRQITIAPGLAWMNYDDFKGVSVCSLENTVLTVPDADNTLNRVDRVVLQFDTASNLTAIRLKTGTPAVAAQPPDILQNHNQYELGLCTISVPAGSAAITAANLTDTRADEDVCGVMRDGVTGIPTAQLIAQWRAAQADLETQLRAQLAVLNAEIKEGSAYSKSEADAKFALTADKISTALGYAPTRIISSTNAPPSDVSTYQDGTLWITYSTSASADEAVDDTDIHIPEDETVADDSTDAPEDTVQDETAVTETTTVISDDAEPEEG